MPLFFKRGRKRRSPALPGAPRRSPALPAAPRRSPRRSPALPGAPWRSPALPGAPWPSPALPGAPRPSDDDDDDDNDDGAGDGAGDGEGRSMRKAIFACLAAPGAVTSSCKYGFRFITRGLPWPRGPTLFNSRGRGTRGGREEGEGRHRAEEKAEGGGAREGKNLYLQTPDRPPQRLLCY